MSRKRIRHDITPPSAMLCNKAAATRLPGLSVLQRGDHHVPCVRPVVNHQHGRLVDWHGVGSTIIDGERSRKQARIGWRTYGIDEHDGNSGMPGLTAGRLPNPACPGMHRFR